MSVGLSEVQVQPYLGQLANEFGAYRLSVACINSYKNITLSGNADQIDALEIWLKSEGIFARKLILASHIIPPIWKLSHEIMACRFKIWRRALPLRV